MFTTFLIFHLSVTSQVPVSSPNTTQLHPHHFLPAPLHLRYSLTNHKCELCSLHSSTSLPTTTSILQDPNLTNTLHPSLMFSKDMGSLSSHITYI